MRIIGGSGRGIRINIPKSLKLRPTTDLCKEALFNILNNEFNFTNIKVLDLFCGSGGISYEFASRGTKKITSVDSNIRSLNFIKKFSYDQKFEISVIRSDVFTYIKKINTEFDVIFADPPYDYEDIKYVSIINEIFKKNCIKSDGYLIIEHSSRKDFIKHPNFNKSKKYGDSILSFFKILNNWLLGICLLKIKVFF